MNCFTLSPATEALELLDDPNVMFDLNEMLKRDPTLSSLVKEEPGVGGGGHQFVPHPHPQFGVQASASDGRANSLVSSIECA